MLNYWSSHSYKQKVNVANNLTLRKKSLSSPMHDQQQTDDIIHQQLKTNSFPKQLVNRLINSYKYQKSHQPTSSHSLEEQLRSCQQPSHTTPMISSTTFQSNNNKTDPTESNTAPDIHHPLINTASVHPAVIQQHRTPSQSECHHLNSTISHNSQPSTSIDPSSRSSTSKNSRPQPAHSSQITSYVLNPANFNIQPEKQNRLIPKEQTTNHQITETPSTIAEPNELIDHGSIQNTTYKSFLYVPGLTERISKTIAHDYPNIKLAARQYHTVGSLYTNVKDTTSKTDQRNVIYNIPCNNCQRCYIGMTQNKLCMRLAGHKTHMNRWEEYRTNMENNEIQIAELRGKTALMEHSIDNEHVFNLDNTKIVDRSRYPNTLTFLEMCHIYNTPHTVNRRLDINGLNTAYAAILNTIKNYTKHNQRDEPTISTIAETQTS